MRFRYEGVGWSVAGPIRTLGRQIEAAWPARRPEDGTIASSGHAKWPASDHGVDPAGIVRALDVGVTGWQGRELAEALRSTRDPRIAYVIHNRRIFSSTRTPWQWRHYSGSNPHTTHVHVSSIRSHVVDRDSALFDVDLGGIMQIDDLQTALNDAGYGPLAVDGIYGPNTHSAFVEALSAQPGDTGVTAEWVNDRIARATRNVIRFGDTLKAKRFTTTADE